METTALERVDSVERNCICSHNTEDVTTERATPGEDYENDSMGHDAPVQDQETGIRMASSQDCRQAVTEDTAMQQLLVVMQSLCRNTATLIEENRTTNRINREVVQENTRVMSEIRREMIQLRADLTNKTDDKESQPCSTAGQNVSNLSNSSASISPTTCTDTTPISTISVPAYSINSTHRTALPQHSQIQGEHGDSSQNQNCNHGNRVQSVPENVVTYAVSETQKQTGNTTSMKDHIKLPPFNGKESWKVWYNRFQVVAGLERWTENKRLQELLPRLQGVAGEFVFSELPQDILTKYTELISELDSRFRVVETRKTFESQFNRRQQKVGESYEEFSADLKRLYDKAHEVRNPDMRREALLRRFMNGVLDDKARFEVEFHKDPRTVDEAVHQMVAYTEAKTRGSTPRIRNHYHDKEAVLSSTSDSVSDDDDLVEFGVKAERKRRKGKYVRKVAFQNHASKVKDKGNTRKGETEKSEETNVLMELKEAVNAIEERVNKIETNKGQGEGQRQQQGQGRWKGKPQHPVAAQNKADMQCYNCKGFGHIARDCRSESKTHIQGRYPGRNEFNAPPPRGNAAYTQLDVTRRPYGNNNVALN